jgi:hypothetical protein
MKPKGLVRLQIRQDVGHSLSGHSRNCRIVSARMIEGAVKSRNRSRCSPLVRQRGPIADRLFTIEFLVRGAEAFAFTFD